MWDRPEKSPAYLLDHNVPIEVVSRMLGHQEFSKTQNFYSAYTESRRKKDTAEICSASEQLEVWHRLFDGTFAV